MRQLTKDEAVHLHDSRAWEKWTPRERATFQMVQDRLCMPFDVFHKAIADTLGRPVWTHEFGLNREGLAKELLGEAPPPTFDEIFAMLPPEKTIVIQA